MCTKVVGRDVGVSGGVDAANGDHARLGQGRGEVVDDLHYKIQIENYSKKEFDLARHLIQFLIEI